MVDTLTPTDGLTDRQRYDLIRRNQASMDQVETLLLQDASKVLSLAEQFDQQQMGGYLRTVVPGLVDKWGNVNATLAMKYYDEQRLLWRQRNPSAFSPNAGQRRRATQSAVGRSERFAAAKLKSELFVASMPKFDALAKAEPIIGYGMQRFQAEGYGAMRDAVTNSMTRAVGSYNRDTILYNAGLDDAVYKVQRVAEPTACAFCVTVAFSSPGWTVSDIRTADYAIDFHDNCKCSIETLYVGDSPIRPDYYDKFEEDYIAAAQEVGTTNPKNLFAEMRKQSGRR